MGVSNPFLALAKSGGVSQGRFHTLDITGGTIGVSGGTATIAVSVDQAGTYNWSGGHTFSSQITATGGISMGAATVRSNGTVAANGTTQGAGTTLTKDINYVTSATGGSATAIKLPAGSQGLTIDIINATAVALQVFPQNSAAIDSLGTNAAFTLAAGAVARFFGYSATQWYGTVIQTGVTSITGTSNQVIASASTGSVTLSLPQDIATTSVVQFAEATLGDLTVTGYLSGTWAGFSGGIEISGSVPGFTLSGTGQQYAIGYNSTSDILTIWDATNSATRFSIKDTTGLVTVPCVAHTIRTGLNAATTVQDSDTYLRFATSSNRVLTLPAASSCNGRRIVVANSGAHTITSASSNVVPRNSTSAGTAILAASAGAWAELVSNGTNWFIMAGS